MMKTVLEVEDDFSVRESVKKALGEAGYQAVLEAGGLEDVARLVANEIDVVLLDIGLPNQSTWKTWQHLGRQPCEAPMIIITGHTGKIKSALASNSEWLTEKPPDALRPPQRIQLVLARSKETESCRPDPTPYLATA